MKIHTIALDLEGTLISNAVSRFTRPGLKEFLNFCHDNFPQVVIYTAVNEAVFRQIAAMLVDLDEVPEWFSTIPHYQMHGAYKGLRNIEGADVETITDRRSLEEI